MTVFNLWNPFRNDPKSLEIDITRAETAHIHRGTPSLVRACLGAFGCHLAPSSWEFVPTRCNYYSDYPNEDDWRDRWPLTWLLRVRFSEDCPVPSSTSAIDPTGIDSFDASVDSQLPTRANSGNVLVMVSFLDKSPPPGPPLQFLLPNNHSEPRLVAPDECAYRRVDSRHSQLRLLFRNIDTPATIPSFTNLLKDLEGQGGLTPWRKLIATRAR